MRDRIVVLGGVIAAVGLSWACLAWLHGTMPDMSGMPAEMVMPGMGSWTAAEVAWTFVMWTVMMAAMMLPSAVPMILTFTAVQRFRGAAASVRRMSGLFTLGYVVAWAGFSLAATLVQWGLAEAALLSPMTQATGTRLGGAILVAAGLFQWTPLNRTSLLTITLGP